MTLEQSVNLFKADRELITDWIKEIISDEYENSVLRQMIIPVFANENSKKLRPLIIVYCFRMIVGEDEDESLLKPLCSAIEISHNASLLIDDIFDKDLLRRGEESFFVKHGTFSALSIAYNLSAFVFELSTRADNPTIVREYGKAGTALSSALYLSKDLKSKKKVSKEFFMDVLHRKTSALFETSAKIGALLSGHFKDIDTSTIDVVAKFGQLFGTAYQLRDDVLAIIGSIEDLGKEPDSDITNRFQSLITIEAMGLASDKDRIKLEDFYLNADEIDPETIRNILIDSGGVKKVIDTTLELRNEALAILSTFPDSNAKDKLIKLTSLINFESLKPYILNK
ncbi:MAG: Geranylgeranyl diphosphate synthase [Candidatus Heimdallarchaeota archaeon LC_2]|nr:MAG: Geranylgeranyl diphosphate synthase [Candidatus Heimdallarchaeota archaeon LC_2]